METADVVVAESGVPKERRGNFSFMATPLDHRHTVWTKTEGDAMRLAVSMAGREYVPGDGKNTLAFSPVNTEGGAS